MKNKSIREKAIKLRHEGYSYSHIVKNVGVSKSTLSAWLKEIPFLPNSETQKRILTGPLKSGRASHNKRVQEIKKIKKEAKNEIGKITRRDLWMLGIGLYLGEGSKTYEIIRVINSDPKIVKLAIDWFRIICNLSEKNITVAIHLYPDNDVKECLTYWSKKLNISLVQFRKTQIDHRTGKSAKKTRKLQYGTAHVTIISNGNPKFGVKLHRRIMGWMDHVLDQK